MTTKNTIGLDASGVSELIPALNNLLANYQLHYQNLRGLHWNIRGNNFFELHVKFEEFYNSAQLKIDQIAERILTLGYTPLHTFTDYLADANIEEAKNMHDGVGAVKIVVAGYQVLLQLEREILFVTAENGDDGTQDLITSYVAEQEKTIWMLNAWLNGR